MEDVEKEQCECRKCSRKRKFASKPVRDFEDAELVEELINEASRSNPEYLEPLQEEIMRRMSSRIY